MKKNNIWKYLTITLLVFIVGVSGFSYFTGYIMPDTGGKEKILETYYHFDDIIPIKDSLINWNGNQVYKKNR